MQKPHGPNVFDNFAGAVNVGVRQETQTTVEKYAQEEKKYRGDLKLPTPVDRMRWDFGLSHDGARQHTQFASRAMQDGASVSTKSTATTRKSP